MAFSEVQCNPTISVRVCSIISVSTLYQHRSTCILLSFYSKTCLKFPLLCSRTMYDNNTINKSPFYISTYYGSFLVLKGFNVNSLQSVFACCPNTTCPRTQFTTDFRIISKSVQTFTCRRHVCYLKLRLVNINVVCKE